MYSATNHHEYGLLGLYFFSQYLREIADAVKRVQRWLSSGNQASPNNNAPVEVHY